MMICRNKYVTGIKKIDNYSFHKKLLSEPKDSVVIGQERDFQAPWHNEAREYKNLLSKLQGVHGLPLDNRSSRMSLAFLVEEAKNQNPDNWQNDIKELNSDIDRAAKTKGSAGVSELMSEKVTTAYMNFLDRKKEECPDESGKNKLDIMKDIAQDDLDYSKELCAQGKAVGFGGVSIDHIPPWYYVASKL